MHRLLLVGAVTIPALAFTLGGGWATTTIEDVPEYAVAGKPFDLTYTVRQHGYASNSRFQSSVTIESSTEKQHPPKTVDALSLGEGMYRARVTIPTAGKWSVHTLTGGFPGGMPTLTVIAPNAPAPAPMAPYDRGKQLFIAKSCATCHSNQNAFSSYPRVSVGPDLTEPKFARAYLERFLANPNIKTDWRSDMRMPNLGLRPAEINALIAFLNQEKQ
jgi:mono/diheme cytochrome c family protein